VALHAFAAARLLLTAGRAAIDQYLLATRLTAAAAGWDRQRDGQTDGRPIVA